MGWKDPPKDPTKRWLNKSLEIQIMLACNWSCHACDQHSNFAGLSYVKKGTMTLSQIEHFIRQMKEANAYFGRIRLVGGEPSLHPKLTEIVRLLHAELVPSHVHQLEIVTNGSHPEKLGAIRHLVKVRVSDESDKQKHHTANLRATPNSLGYEGKRCGAPEHCGWSLSYYGFAPCSSGAGIMRLHDLMDIHRVAELPTAGVREGGTGTVWPKLQDLCNLCYHALRPEDKVKCGTGMKEGQHELNTPSEETWKALAPWLNGRAAPWEVYGQLEAAK